MKKSPLDKSCEIADLLSKELPDSWVRPILLTAISKLSNEDHKRLYEALFGTKKDTNFLKSNIN